MFKRIDSGLGRTAIGAAVFAVAVAAVGVPVAADESTGEVDGAIVAVGAPPVPTTTVPVETGEVDGAVVAVGAPPVPTTTVPVETGEVGGAVVAVVAPPVPAASGGSSVPTGGGAVEQPVVGRLRAAIVQQQIANALADATADAVLSLRTGR